MKKLVTILCLAVTFSFSCMALTHEVGPLQKEHSFEFKFNPYQGENFTFSVKAKDQYIALERAAMSCFTHYKKQRQVSSEEGLDIIDICVNPKML